MSFQPGTTYDNRFLIIDEIPLQPKATDNDYGDKRQRNKKSKCFSYWHQA